MPSFGLQVRLVDAASASRLQSDEVASQFDLRQYFACAQQIEDEHRCDGQDVVWCAAALLVSEATADTRPVLHDGSDTRGLLARARVGFGFCIAPAP